MRALLYQKQRKLIWNGVSVTQGLVGSLAGSRKKTVSSASSVARSSPSGPSTGSGTSSSSCRWSPSPFSSPRNSWSSNSFAIHSGSVRPWKRRNWLTCALNRLQRRLHRRPGKSSTLKQVSETRFNTWKEPMNFGNSFFVFPIMLIFRETNTKSPGWYVGACSRLRSKCFLLRLYFWTINWRAASLHSRILASMLSSLLVGLEIHFRAARRLFSRKPAQMASLP